MTNRVMAYPVARQLVLFPFLLLTNQCSSDDKAADHGNNGTGISGAPTSTVGSAAGTGGSSTGAIGGAGGTAAGGHSSGATDWDACAGSAGRYCRETDPQGLMLFDCPADYCGALASVIRISDGKSGLFEGATVRAGRCAAPSDLDAVYFGGGVVVVECFYRTGSFVGWVTWDHTASVPTVYGEFPESVIDRYPATCGALASYRPLSPSSSAGAAGASSAVDNAAGSTSSGAGNVAGAAGTAGASSIGSCYRAATATCEPC